MAEIIYLTEEISDNVVLTSKYDEPMIGIGRTNNSIRRSLEHHNRDSKATAGINLIDEYDFEIDGYTSNYVEPKLQKTLLDLGFRSVDRESHFIDKILKKSRTEVFTGKSKKEIKEKIENGDYITTSDREKNPHLESINYLLWEFMKDRKDPRIEKVFSDVCIPNGVNQGELDIDFTKYSVEDFLKEIMKLKN